MSHKEDKIISKLSEFGLEQDEAAIYLYLLKDSPKSVLDISRALNLGRNVIYRSLESLELKELVTAIRFTSGMKFSAQHYSKLEKQLEKKEKELLMLKTSSRDLFGELAQLASAQENGNIIYYSGIEGMRQITMNSLNAKGELLLFCIGSLADFMDRAAVDKVQRTFVERKIVTKEITNLKRIMPWTEVSELARHYWEPRYISAEKLTVNFEFIIYNDTFALYDFKDKKPWGIEVVSPAVASMQRQLFNFLWNSGKKMKLLDDRGSAEVV